MRDGQPIAKCGLNRSPMLNGNRMPTCIRIRPVSSSYSRLPAGNYELEAQVMGFATLHEHVSAVTEIWPGSA